MGDTQIKFDMHTLKHQKNEFTMTVGKRTAQVLCKNKRDGKQRASQTILQVSVYNFLRNTSYKKFKMFKYIILKIASSSRLFILISIVGDRCCDYMEKDLVKHLKRRRYFITNRVFPTFSC